MNKKSYCILLSLFLSVSLFTQVAADPRDPIYEDIIVWENLGLLKI